MTGGKKALIFGGMVAASLAMTMTTFAASPNNPPLRLHTQTAAHATQPIHKFTARKGEKYVILNFPVFKGADLTAPKTLRFVFTVAPAIVPIGQIGSSGTLPIMETGTLYSTHPVRYRIPLPNFGRAVNVYVSMNYISPTPNSKYYQETVGPLVDTLPETPLAAALPFGMLGVWYVMRKRRVNAHD
ncbi:MAG: hypothetical protein ACYCYO_08600 [Bacilli bacterium]